MTKLSESVTLMVISRLSMAAVAPLFLIAGAYIELRFSTISAQAGAATEISQENGDDINDLSAELLVVQTNQANGKALRDAQYGAIIGLIDRLTNAQDNSAQTLSYIKAQVDLLVKNRE